MKFNMAFLSSVKSIFHSYIVPLAGKSSIFTVDTSPMCLGKEYMIQYLKTEVSKLIIHFKQYFNPSSR